jgi:hypothetical protein
MRKDYIIMAVREVSCKHSNGREGYYFLGCDAMWSCKCFLMFWRNVPKFIYMGLQIISIYLPDQKASLTRRQYSLYSPPW